MASCSLEGKAEDLITAIGVGLASACLSSSTPPAAVLAAGPGQGPSCLCAWPTLFPFSSTLSPLPLPGPSRQVTSHPQHSTPGSGVQALTEPAAGTPRTLLSLTAGSQLLPHIRSRGDFTRSRVPLRVRTAECPVQNDTPCGWHSPCAELVLSKCGRQAGQVPCGLKGRELCLPST